jgi:Protein of unknown function (DUF1176)
VSSFGFTLVSSVLIAAGIAYAPVQGAAPEYREIKDWVLTCDNTHSCLAKYVAADYGVADGGGYLSLERGPGPNAGLTVTVETVEGDTAPDPTTLHLDGHSLPGFAWKIDLKAQAATLAGDAALRFARAIRDGGKLSFSDDKDAPFVSLSGMKAALLAMDENQGRLGGETALIRTGPKPASAVPAAKPAPVVYAAPARGPLIAAAAFAAQVRRARADTLGTHDCDASQASQDEARPLDAANALVVLGCQEAAYQGSVLIFIAPRNAPAKARQLILPLEPPLSARDTSTEGEYTEGEWDPKTATFSQSAKGRGIADCGESTVWTFDGKEFVLSTYNAQLRCGGPPGDWPTLYRTRTVVR